MTAAVRRTVAVLVIPLALAACSTGDGEPAESTTPSTAATPTAGAAPFATQPGQEVDAKTFLDKTSQAVRDKGTFALRLTTTLQNQRLTMAGQADVSDDANPKAALQMQTPGASGAIDIVVVDQNVFVKLPGKAGGGRYVKLSLADATATSGQDLSRVMNPAEYLKAQQSSTSRITYAGPQDVAGQRLHRYTIEHTAAAAPTGGTNPTGQAVPTQTQVWLDDGALIRKIDLHEGGTAAQMTMDRYGEPVQVAAPPSDSVTTMPGLGGGSGPTPTASR